jgi:outer membrane protein insertion porin family
VKSLRTRIGPATAAILLVAWGAGLRAAVGQSAAAEGAQPKIENIEIEGNRQYKQETILYYISSKIGDLYDPERLRQDFLSLYNTGFFEDLTFLAREGAAGKIVVIEVVEKPIVAEYKFDEGLKSVSSDEAKKKLKEAKIELTGDRPLDRNLTHRAAVFVEGLLRQEGRDYPEVTPTEQPRPDGKVDVVFKVDEGTKVRIAKVNFVGNQEFSNGRLRKVMKDTRQSGMWAWLTHNDRFSEEKFETDRDRVREFYQDRGYFDIEVGAPKVEVVAAKGEDEAGKRKLHITIPINEGVRYKLGKVTVTGNKTFQERAFHAALDLKEGEWFSRKKVIKSLETMGKAYGNYGFLDRMINPIPKPQSNTNILDLEYKVTEGPQYKVRYIEFKGNQKTKDKVLRRQLRIYENHLFSQGALELSVLRLNQLGYFEGIEPDIKKVEESESASAGTGTDGQEPADGTADKTAGAPAGSASGEQAYRQVDVTIKVNEIGRNQIQFGAGVSGIEGGFFNFLYQTQNFLGGGSTFGFSAQVGGRTRNLSINYYSPFFLDRQLGFGFTVYDRSLRYSFLDYEQAARGASVRFTKPLTEFSLLAFGYGYQSTSSTQLNQTTVSIPFITPYSDGRFSTSTVDISMVRNGVDNPIFPTSGLRWVVGTEYAGAGGQIQFLKPRGEVSWFLPVNSSRTMIVGIHGEAALAKALGEIAAEGGAGLPWFERFFLGGETNIRGFRISSISPIYQDPTTMQRFRVGGNSMWYTNFEYMFQIAKYVRLVPFLDTGGVYATDFNDPNRLETPLVRGAYGLELRFTLPIFNVPFRIIYGVNIDPVIDENKTDFLFTLGTNF